MPPVPDEYVDERLRFRREPRGDRFAHAIKLNVDGQYRTLLESLEPTLADTQDNGWPCSPPLIDWHFEKRNDTSVFMAVGAAGKTHWAVSIEIVRNKAVRFEVATRVNVAPLFLGSQYRLVAPCRSIDATSAELLPGVMLTCDPATTRLRLVEQSSAISIEPVPTAYATWPQTIRWRYAI
jgi:hypothetical protein